MTENKIIHKQMALVLKDLGPISKGQRNTSQGAGFAFRGIDDIYNALNPLISKHGIYCTPNVLEHSSSERTTKSGGILNFVLVKVKYTFWAEDGSFVECVTYGEAMDSGDKATNKAMAAAHKYALLQTFCIATEGDNDPDAHSYEVQARSYTPPSKAQYNQQNQANLMAQKAARASTTPPAGNQISPEQIYDHSIPEHRRYLLGVYDEQKIPGQAQPKLTKDLMIAKLTLGAIREWIKIQTGEVIP